MNRQSGGVPNHVAGYGTVGGEAMLLICAASSGHNLKLAERLAALADELSLTNRVLDLTDTNLPMYTPEREAAGRPDALDPVEEAFRSATAMVIAAPEYNGSMPPVLNNAIAWLSVCSDDFRELFTRKPIGLATHSGGGGQKVLVAMRLQLGHLGATVLGRELLTTQSKPLNEQSARDVLAELDVLRRR